MPRADFIGDYFEKTAFVHKQQEVIMINFGMSREEFLEKYYEKNFYLKKNALSSNMVDWNDIDNALFAWDPLDELLRLFKNGLIPAERYTEQFTDMGMQRTRIVKDVFYDYMRTGATLVLNRLDTKLVTIQNLTMELARFVGDKTVANGYVAFGGDGTFAKHWDTHDVFAVQLIGRKRWRLYRPTFPLPLPNQLSKEYKHECPAEPVFDDVLEQGDILYFPRGWWHEAIPLENEETLHIAVGIHTSHIVDYIVWSCFNALQNFIELRQSIRLERNELDKVESALTAVQETLLNPDNLTKYRHALVSSERIVTPFSVAEFGKNTHPGMAPNAKLSLNTSFGVDGGSPSIPVNGFALKVDDLHAEPLRTICCKPSISIKDAMVCTPEIYHEKTNRLICDLLKKDVIALR